jgi:hypothetical protein
MAKNIYNLRDELRQLQFENYLLQKIDCSRSDSKKYVQMIKNGEKLPDGVFQYKSDTGEKLYSFYTIYESDLTESEKLEYFMLKQNMSTDNIRTIKNCVVFFTVITVITLVLSFIVFLAGNS